MRQKWTPLSERMRLEAEQKLEQEERLASLKLSPAELEARDLAKRQREWEWQQGLAKLPSFQALPEVQVFLGGRLHPLATFFGRTSNARLADELYREDPSRYQSYRAEAVKRGLLG